MNITWTLALLIFYLLFPVLILFLEIKYAWIRKVSPVVICYITGFIIGNIGILPLGADKLQDNINMIVIPLAIPLLLFSIDIRRYWKMAKSTLVSLILGVLSALVMVIFGFFLLKDSIPDIWKVSGMLVGLYTGGTPNIASIKVALDVDPNTYIVTHTYDLMIGAFILLFLITIGQKFFLLFMRPFKPSDGLKAEDPSKEFAELTTYEGIFKKEIFLPLLAALGVAILIFGVIGGLSFLLPENSQMPIVILGITTLALLASLSPRINKIEKTFQAGMYFILIFCLVVSSMADIRKILFDMNWNLLFYIILAVPGALLLHAFLSWIFKVDADNMIISSTALSMSPPFVPVVAAAIKNKDVILSGIIIGVIGYAIGNYLGVAIAYLLDNFG